MLFTRVVRSPPRHLSIEADGAEPWDFGAFRGVCLSGRGLLASQGVLTTVAGVGRGSTSPYSRSSPCFWPVIKASLAGAVRQPFLFRLLDESSGPSLPPVFPKFLGTVASSDFPARPRWCVFADLVVKADERSDGSAVARCSRKADATKSEPGLA